MKSKNYAMNGDTGAEVHTGSGRRKSSGSKRSCCSRCCDVTNQVWTLKSLIMILVAFICTLPIPILIPTSIGRCAYVLVSMALLWATEALPIPVTALVPVVLFPALGVLEAAQVANSYFGNTSFLFIGGLMVAIAVEESGLHRRVALRVMSLVGSDPKWIMMGLMLPTWFLSMWISNTATASMMIPIVEAVLVQLKLATKPVGDSVRSTDGTNMSMPSIHSIADSEDTVQQGEMSDDTKLDDDATLTRDASNDDVTQHKNGGIAISNKHISIAVDHDDAEDLDDAGSDVTDEGDKYHQRLCKGLSLSIAYAANTGGIATLTGTPPNLVFAGQAKTSCLKKQPKAVSEAIKRVMQNEYKRLGSFSFAEAETLVCFIIVALLWLCRSPQFVPGWGSLFAEGYMSDSQAAVFVSLLFFILPAKKPTIFCWRYRDGIKQKAAYTPLLSWQVAQAKMPWGIILLLGGGFALAKGCRVSGLSNWFGEQLATFEHLDPWLLNLVICIAVAMATEITSNTATATLLMPIMAELSLKLKVNPLYFMSSAAIATSFAFMMPVATPPNAIVFSHGHLSIPDMVGAGFMMNVIAVLCLCLAVNTWGNAIFDFQTMPDIFSNTTAAVAPS